MFQFLFALAIIASSGSTFVVPTTTATADDFTITVIDDDGKSHSVSIPDGANEVALIATYENGSEQFLGNFPTDQGTIDLARTGPPTGRNPASGKTMTITATKKVD